jgi:hypothetical protein
VKTDEEYRRNAAEAQSCADKARTDTDRAAWLRVAQGWLSLLRKRPQSAAEKFEAAAENIGTRQSISERSQ